MRHALVLALMLALGFGFLARAQSLNLGAYTLTFDDDFTKPDIVASGPGGAWIAHTPWHGDFGNDVFGNPGPGGPFSFSQAGLAITATHTQGQWQAGLISSRDSVGPDAKGFAQEYGYFEMTAQLPAGAGVWPAFWLEGTERDKGVPEIDVMEFYGHAGAEYHITEHYWVNNKDVLGAWHVVQVPAGLLTRRDNRFGVVISPAHLTFYFNRAPVWQTATPPEYRQKMFLLADLAIGGGWPYGRLKSPVVMRIRDIRAYQLKP